jgi:hypothetical protein
MNLLTSDNVETPWSALPRDEAELPRWDWTVAELGFDPAVGCGPTCLVCGVAEVTERLGEVEAAGAPAEAEAEVAEESPQPPRKRPVKKAAPRKPGGRR